MYNKSRYAGWLQSFALDMKMATDPEFARQVTAGVAMESGNDGETKPTGAPLPVGFDGGSDDRQKAFKDSLPSVALKQNPKDEEQQRIQRDTATTQSDIDGLIKSREKMMTGDPKDAVKTFFYPHSENGGNRVFAQNDLAKIARAAANDVLDSLEDVLQHAEEFTHDKVPLGQREQVFSSIEKTLKAKGIGTRFNRTASSEAPSSGFDDYTWRDVAEFIEDDYRSVPGDKANFAGGTPDSYNGGNRTPTSIENKAIKNPASYENKYYHRTPTANGKKNKKYASLQSLKQKLASTIQQHNEGNTARREVELVKKEILANRARRIRKQAFNELMNEGITAPPLGMMDQEYVDDSPSMDFDFGGGSDDMGDMDEDMGGEGDILSEVKELAQQLLDLCDGMGGGEELEDSFAPEDDSESDFESDTDSEPSEEESMREASRRNRFIKAHQRRR